MYIYHNLGLGDHIICNGLVREYAKQYNNIRLFCKDNYYESISFMYRDLDNIVIIPVKDSDKGVIDYIKVHNIDWNNDFLKLGPLGKNWANTQMLYNENFYYQAKLSFETRWKSFYLKRDMERENKIFKSIDIKQPYIVIHEDKPRRFVIDRKYLKNPNVISIKGSLTNNIFDYIKVFQEASEIHIIESCFLFLLDSIDLGDKPLYAHRYARSYDWFNKPQLIKKWNIL